MMEAGSRPENNPLPAGLLVLYDEAKGVRQPSVKIFNPSPNVEQEVNEWMRTEPGLLVHRIEWVPSGGLLGASVVFSKGHKATESIRLPVPRGAAALPSAEEPVESLGFGIVVAGVLAGLVALVLFTIFYPVTWYDEPGAYMNADVAVKMTVLVAGLSLVLMFSGIAAVVRARLR